MSVLAFANGVADHGLGEDARRLREIISSAFDLSPTIEFGERNRNVVRALEGARREAAEQDWDGHEARAINPGSHARALAFLSALPTTVPLPDTTVDPEGDVLLEWYLQPRRVLTLTIDPDGIISYAALIGRNKVHGREQFVDTIPQTVADALARILARRS